MPEHLKTMWGAVEDVLSGPSVLAWSAALPEFAFQNGEYRVLTCDGTVKIALALKGYKRNVFRTSVATTHMAWKLEEMVSRVFTVLGTAGRCTPERRSCVHHCHFDSFIYFYGL